MVLAAASGWPLVSVPYSFAGRLDICNKTDPRLVSMGSNRAVSEDSVRSCNDGDATSAIFDILLQNNVYLREECENLWAWRNIRADTEVMTIALLFPTPHSWYDG